MNKKEEVIVLSGKREIKATKAEEREVGLNANTTSLTLVK